MGLICRLGLICLVATITFLLASESMGAISTKLSNKKTFFIPFCATIKTITLEMLLMNPLSLNSLHAGYFFKIFLSSADIFYVTVFKIFSQIRPNIMLGLIWVRTVYKDIQ